MTLQFTSFFILSEVGDPIAVRSYECNVVSRSAAGGGDTSDAHARAILWTELCATKVRQCFFFIISHRIQLFVIVIGAAAFVHVFLFVFCKRFLIKSCVPASTNLSLLLRATSSVLCYNAVTFGLLSLRTLQCDRPTRCTRCAQLLVHSKQDVVQVCLCIFIILCVYMCTFCEN